MKKLWFPLLSLFLIGVLGCAGKQTIKPQLETQPQAATPIEEEKVTTLPPPPSQEQIQEAGKTFSVSLAVGSVTDTIAQLLSRYGQMGSIELYKPLISAMLSEKLGPMGRLLDLEKTAVVGFIGNLESLSKQRHITILVPLIANSSDALTTYYQLEPATINAYWLISKGETPPNEYLQQMKCALLKGDAPHYLACTNASAENLLHQAYYLNGQARSTPKDTIFQLKYSMDDINRIMNQKMDDPKRQFGFGHNLYKELQQAGNIRPVGNTSIGLRFAQTGMTLNMSYDATSDDPLIMADLKVPGKIPAFPSMTDNVEIAVTMSQMFPPAWGDRMMKWLKASPHSPPYSNTISELLESLIHITNATEGFVYAYGIDESKSVAAFFKHMKKRKPNAVKARLALKGWNAIGLKYKGEDWNQIIDSLLKLDAEQNATDNPTPITGGNIREAKLKKKDKLPTSARYLIYTDRTEPNRLKTNIKTVDTQDIDSHVIIASDNTENLWIVWSKRQALAIAQMNSLLKGEDNLSPHKKDLLMGRHCPDSVGSGFITDRGWEFALLSTADLEKVKEDLEKRKHKNNAPTVLPGCVTQETIGDDRIRYHVSLEIPNDIISKIYTSAGNFFTSFGKQ